MYVLWYNCQNNRDAFIGSGRLQYHLAAYRHLKDGTRDRKGLALGDGEAPVPAVRDKAIELGLRMIVESEGLQPTGIEEVARCARFLKAEG